jgi:FkbM family methyltransferase
MEGNECYKFSTIRNYIDTTRGDDIKIIIDIGANVGTISIMMKHYFPNANIYGFEAVKEYHDIACSNTQHISSIKLFNKAVSAQHLFTDDIGKEPRRKAVNLQILKGLPEAGPGWLGGSVVVASDHELITRYDRVFGFEKIDQKARPISLDRIVRVIRRLEKSQSIDLIKLDCEGCEHSTIGCADIETLKMIRFIVGEYHDIKRFYNVMKNKLFLTHKVNLIGTKIMGCFFAEKLDGEKDGILRFNKNGMLVQRPWLCEFPIDWHIFNEQFVLDQDRHWHALS